MTLSFIKSFHDSSLPKRQSSNFIICFKTSSMIWCHSTFLLPFSPLQPTFQHSEPDSFLKKPFVLSCIWVFLESSYTPRLFGKLLSMFPGLSCEDIHDGPKLSCHNGNKYIFPDFCVRVTYVLSVLSTFCISWSQHLTCYTLIIDLLFFPKSG